MTTNSGPETSGKRRAVDDEFNALTRCIAVLGAVVPDDPKALLLALAGCDLAQHNAALIMAARGATDCVREIIPVCDAKATNDRGQTALIAAAGAGRLDCIRLLLPHSDARAFDATGRNALMHAAENGHADVVEALLPVSEPRATVAEGSEQGATALLFAARARSARCVDLLLPHSDPGAIRADGSTLLMEATACDATMLRRLLPLSDPNAQDGLGRTALMIALERGRCVASIRVLRRASDIMLRDNEGCDALWYAVRSEQWSRACDQDHNYESDRQCVQLLLPKCGPRRRLTAQRADSIARAMDHALWVGALGSARALLPFCDPLRPAANGETLLMRAAETPHPELVRMLLPLSDPLAVNKRGHSARALAAGAERTDYADPEAVNETVHLLAEAEARLDAKAVQEALGEAMPSNPEPAAAPIRTRASKRL